MNNSEIRDIFYSYFTTHHHHKVLSAPLVPAKDPTLLFTNAGMNQFKGVFLRQEQREYQRAVSIQKCMRVSGKHNDFDEVGKSDFHHTFFEMLGNFSFGDYFKEKAIAYAWELLTLHYRFKPEDLWITVFENDDEAFRIWEEKIGIPSHKIIRLGEKDNFWQMGETGPCGPCSEIHFDRGPAFGPEGFTDGNKRFMEVWNLVFMQYDRDDTGTLNPLPAPSIDTGMGMERLTTLLQGKTSNYSNSLFRPIILHTAELAGLDPDSPQHRVAFNVVADHIRALSFLISDGVLPSNDGRGYVLRRILRRAAKHGKSLGFTSNFLHRVSAKVVDMMKEFYPELEYNRNFIAEVILAEEERFNNTLANGLKRFEELLQRAIEEKQAERPACIPGKELFKLSDTYGFPLDFARDLAIEKDVAIDFNGYQEELEQQREKSRLNTAAKQKSIRALEHIDRYATTFTGYDSLEEEEAVVLALYVDGREAAAVEEGGEAQAVFDKTPFYAESGGQIGDVGTGKNNEVFFNITDTRKAMGGSAVLHRIRVKKGVLKPGDTVDIHVDAARRKNTAVHHSATHLLQAALREVLGLHVKQSGSYVGPEKLRFDFTHFKSVTPEELKQVEDMVNRKARENLSIQTDVLKYEDAIARGATAIFEEKYADVVRMLSMGDFSKELCGGTHLSATGEIGLFKITGESSIASGVRRIEAVAGEAGYQYINQQLGVLDAILSHFKQKPGSIVESLIQLEAELKEKEKQLKKTQQPKDDHVDIDTLIAEGSRVGEVPVSTALLGPIDRKQLSAMADAIKTKTGGVAVLFTNADGKSAMVVSVAKELTPKLHAGTIAKDVAAILNGSGGGRPDFAQGGGDEINDILQLKPRIVDIVSRYIK